MKQYIAVQNNARQDWKVTGLSLLPFGKMHAQ